MGRIFTVDFDYDKKKYPALVKITVSEQFFAVSYHVPDASLHYLIPGGKVTYNSIEGFTSITGNNKCTLELIESITNAVEEHLFMLQVTNDEEQAHVYSGPSDSTSW
jgi:hypothetical protein